MPVSKPDNAISVNDLTLAIKNHLNQAFRSVWVSGEISGISRPPSGHIYFTLKDKLASIKGIIWQSAAQRIKFQPEEGMDVLCLGDVDVYPDRGTYQLIVRQIQPLGIGPMQLAFKQLHAKLQSEGLFDPEIKKLLPRFPQRVAVVTSPSGAAIRDFLQVLGRRWSGTEVVVVPAKVQGAGSAEQIARAIRACSRFAEVPDVVVVTRGGGSIEDLWSFNEEVVCRAIHDCPIPVVSAVGHEIDVTLSDLTADVRALTPSEAAEILVPDRRELLQQIRGLQRQLQSGLRGRLVNAQRQLDSISSRPVLRRPLELYQQHSQGLDETSARMDRAIKDRISSSSESLKQYAARLEAINPLSVLARGYSITTNDKGILVKNSDAVSVGDQMNTRTDALKIVSRVEKIDSVDEKNPSKS